MKQKPKRRKSIILRLIVLVAVAYFVVSSVGQVDELVEMKAELAELEKQRNSMVLEIEEMESLLASESFDDIIEKAARERLGYVYGDETIFIDNSAN